MKKTHKRILKHMLLFELKVNPRNPRRHSAAQIEAIAKSIEAFGFNAPILIDRYGNIIAGHGRFEAGKLLGLGEVPVICLDDLSDAEARAYMLADNKLTDRSSWDDQALSVHLKELSELALEFSIEATGFELPEIDIRIQSLDEAHDADSADEFAVSAGPTVTRHLDLWHCEENRIFCGSACEAESHTAVMGGELATAIFTDPPYNLKIAGNVSGLGAVKHEEFVQASGEMSVGEFTTFLHANLALMSAHTVPGAIMYVCMDFRHMGELHDAANMANLSLLNLCVWVKTNGGMGSFYRSRHELVFVFANGTGPHINNIQLGRHGRNRTNVWNYAGSNIRPRKGGEDLLALHPTVKPVMLVADAMRDSTKRGDLVLDPFLGSGTSILAAQRVGRRCYGIELEPRFVDTAIARWERMTGKKATLANGQTFAQVAAERGAAHE